MTAPQTPPAPTNAPDQEMPAWMKEAYGKYRTPYYYGHQQQGPLSGGEAGLRVGPENYRVSSNMLDKSNIQQLLKRHQITTFQMPPGQNQVEDIGFSRPEQSFWENPQRVARYHNLLRSAPPGWQPPPWLPAKEVEAAYQYLKFRNDDKPWQDWQALGDTDPGASFLKGLQQPPDEYLAPFEKQLARQQAPLSQAEVDAQKPFANWEDLPTWMQWQESLTAPQPGIAGRPEASRMLAAGIQGAMAGLGGAFAGNLIAPGIGAAIGFLGVGAATAYGAYTNQRVPIISPILDLFNVGAMEAERHISMGEVGWKAGFGDLLKNYQLYRDATTWGYEAGLSPLGSNLINEINPLNLLGMDVPGVSLPGTGPTLSAIADIAHAVGLSEKPGGWTGPAKEGEVWRINEGFTTPQPLQGLFGVDAMQEYVQRRLAGEDKNTLDQEFFTRFGESGTLNDFISQTILDPLNLAPFAEGFVGEGAARLARQPRLAEAFKLTRGNPLIDLLPFGVQNIVSAITRQPGSQGLMGALSTYRDMVKRGYWPKGIEPVPASKLSTFDKALAGLTPEGLVRELQPASGKKGVAGFVEYLTTLTPSSKAHVLESGTHDNINLLFSMAKNDPEIMIRLLHQAAGADPVKVGDLGAEVLNSPMTATISAALKEAITDGFDVEMLTNWVTTEQARTLLTTIGTKLGITEGQVLEQLGTNADVMAQRINQIAPTAGSPDQIKALFKPFLGEEPLPWNPEMFQAQLALHLFDHMDAWLAKRFDLKPDHAIFRMSQVMKGMQSLLLLGLNPAYFINNAVNNSVTRAAAGVAGYMTPRQIDGFMKRFGITPDRLRVGLDPSSDGKVTSLHQNAALHKGDAIDKAQSVVDSINKKLGIFSRFSAANERLEGGNAYTIGMSRFWDKNWKRGVGFHKLDPMVEAMLDRQAPGIKEAIYSAIEAGMNREEIDARLLGDYVAPNLSSVLEESARKVYPNSPDLGLAAIKDMGLVPELEKELASAKTPQEVNAAFARVEARLQDFVDEAATNELVHRATEVRNQVVTEADGTGQGFGAALGIFTDLQVKIATRWLHHFGEWQDLYNRRDSMTGEEFDVHVRSQMATDTREWQRINTFELQTYSGIIQALGMETPAARSFIGLLTEAHTNWRKFYDGWDEPRADGTLHHDGRNEKLKKFFASMKKKRGETETDYQTRYSTSWTRLQAELADDYQRATVEENRLQRAMDQHFAQTFEEKTHRPAPEALAWREQVQAIRMQMQEAMQEFRQRSVAMTPEERRAAWTEFIRGYNALIVELKRTEIEGAWTLSRQPAQPGPAEAVAQVEQAGAPVQGPRMANAEEINAQLAGELGPPITAAEQANLGIALRYGITNQAGRPIRPYTVNIVNEYLRSQARATPETGAGVQVPVMITGGMRKTLMEMGYTPAQIKELTPQQAWDAIGRPRQYTPEQLGDIPGDLVERAMLDHQARHQHEDAQAAASTLLEANDIVRMADKTQREAAIHAAGMMARRHVREKLQAAFHANAEEVEAAMLLMDHHADQVARLNKQTPSDATRDAWYATHIANILDSNERGQLQQRQQTQAWYYSQLLRTAETMPAKMTADALNGFLKGKVKADEMRWTGFDDWLEQKRAAGQQVTKEEATEFLRNNQVRIDEVLLGGEGTRSDIPGWAENEKKLAEMGWRIEYNPDDNSVIAFDRIDDPEHDFITADEMTFPEAGPALELQHINQVYATGSTFTLLPEFDTAVTNLRKEGWDVYTRADDPSQEAPLHFYKMGENGPGLDDPGAGDIYTIRELEDFWATNQRRAKQIGLTVDAMLRAQDIFRISERPGTSELPTKFEEYKEPGGTGYRELLLRWDRQTDDAALKAAWDARRKEPGWEGSGEWESQTAETRFVFRVHHVDDLGLTDYQSPHWDQNNVLAHIRFDERSNPAGERVLFIEEIQSDWREQGRKKGYQGQDPELIKQLDQLDQQWLEIQRQGNEAMQEMRWNRHNQREYTAARRRATDLLRQADDIDAQRKALTVKLEEGAPPAPFAKDWESLVIKRAIRWAAENGYNRVSWATGRMNADRYSLSNYIDELQWSKRGKQTYIAGYKDGRRTFGEQVENSKLADYVGVEVTRQILDSTEEGGEIKGQGLAVGGQGMRTFYDHMIPSLVAKYIKKWGGQLETTGIEGLGKAEAGKFTVELSQADGWVLRDPDGDVVDTFKTREEAESIASAVEWRNTPDQYALFDEDGQLQYWNMSRNDANNMTEEGWTIRPMSEIYAEKYGKLNTTNEVNSFAVTPAMREAAMEGQPLFQRGSQINGPAGEAGLPAFRRWFGESQVRGADGQPLIVYHSTGADFDAFRQPNNGEVGIHFGTQEQARVRSEVMRDFLKRKGQVFEPRTMAVYLKLEHPIVLDYDPGTWHPDNWVAIMKHIGRYDLAGQIDEAVYRTHSAMTAQRDRLGKNITAQQLAQMTMDQNASAQQLTINILKRGGFDGVVYANEVEGGGVSYGVFDPTQIKSVNNRGTWDEGNANIFYQRGMPTEDVVARIQDAGWVDPATIVGVFENAAGPQLRDIAQFILGQRQKYVSGQMTARDVAKAYMLTVSSIGSDGKILDNTIRTMLNNGIQFTRDGQAMDLGFYAYRHPGTGEWNIRPEEMTAAWLMSDMGKRALDAIEQGKVTDDWKKFIRARRQVFGRFEENFVERRPGKGKLNLEDIDEITRLVNETEGDPDAISQVMQQMAGIDAGKSGFVKHLLGFGDETTLDIQEINFWTGRMPDEDTAWMIREKWKNNPDIKNAIKDRVEDTFAELHDRYGIGADLPEEAFVHTMHHWLWDAQKNTQTTHQGMYRAMQFAQGSHASVEFLENGRAVIKAINSPNISSIVHEIGHIFRRDLPAADLDVIAKWGGLAGAEEMQLLEQRFQLGDFKWREYDQLRELVRAGQASAEDSARFNELEQDPTVRDFKRYEAAEEKFATGWEKYLAEGDAPTPELRSVFRRFTDWMLKIYSQLKRQFGKVIGFEQTVAFAGIDLGQTVNGTKVRDIFDRLLVDEARRPWSLEQMIGDRLGKIQKDRRYTNFSKYDQQQLAQTGAISELLNGEPDAATARARLEKLFDSGDVYRTTTGQEIDPVAIWDAIKLAEENPDQAPWSPLAMRLGQQAPSAEARLTARERAILHGQVSKLPGQVQQAIRAMAQQMLDDIRQGGAVRIAEGEEGSLAREGNAPWYWAWYEEASKPAGFKRTMRTALEKIIAGSEDANRPMVRQVKNQILAWLTGEQPTDMGLIADPAVLWYLGRKEQLYKVFGQQLDTATPEWLQQAFGTDADQVVSDYIAWLEGPQAEPAPAAPLVERIAFTTQDEANVATTFEKGDPVDLNLAEGMQLVPGDELPRPAGAEEAATRGLGELAREYAADLIDWIESGEQGSEPPPPPGLPPRTVDQARAKVQAQAEHLREYARNRTDSPISRTPPGRGLQIKRARRFKSHNQVIAAFVYQDGKKIALLPDNGEILKPFNDDGARLLGIDSADPASWVIQRGKEILSINPDEPQLPDLPRPEAARPPKPAAAEDPNEPDLKANAVQLFPEPEQPAPRTREHEWITKLKTLGTTSETLQVGSAYLTRAGEFIMLDSDHDVSAMAASGDKKITKTEFMRRTKAVRIAKVMDGNEAVYYLHLVARPSEAQIEAIFKSVPNDYISVMIGDNVDLMESFHTKNDRAQLMAHLTDPFEGGKLYQRRTEHPWVTKAKAYPGMKQSARIKEAGWITPDGMALEFQRQQGKRIFVSHFDIVEDLTGEFDYFDEFVSKTGMIRAEAAPGELVVEIFRRPTPEQIRAILDQAKQRMVTIDLTRPGADKPFDHLEAWGEDAQTIVDFLDERGRLYQPTNETPEQMPEALPPKPKATYVPMISVSNLENVPSPLSGYVENKRSMLQAGHYNEILSLDRAGKFKQIVETFGGSGLLGNAFQRQLKTPRIYNELDPQVVAFHRTVKDNPTAVNDALQAESDQVVAIMKAFPEGGPDAYDAIQNYWKGMQFRLARGSEVEKAALMAINNSGGLSIMGGGSQKIISGASVKEGAYVWRAGKDTFATVQDQIRRHAELLKAVDIKEGDARQRLAEATPDDLVLLDPPYVSRGIDDERVTGYAAGEDLLTLEGALNFIDNDMAAAQAKGIPMIYTNNAHPVLIEALRENGFHIRLVEVRSQNARANASGAGAATFRTEVVAWNDPVGQADAGWRGTRTEEALRRVGSGRVEYLVHRARSKRLAAQHGQAEGVAAGPGAPVGASPAAEPFGAALDEISTESVRPLLRQVREDYQAQLAGSRLKGVKGLDRQAQGEVGKYLKRIESDMGSTKYAAMGYGEQMRDASLLNYNRRYGFDNFLGLGMPYQFWYTRSMMNWAKRMIDRPAWFGMYARLQQMQEKQARNMPTRLKGKVRIPAPWLPDWAGGGIWSDPWGKILPFKQFGQPIEQYTSDKNMVDRRAESILYDMVQAQTISEGERLDAMKTRSGEAWQQAVAQAQLDMDKNADPSSLVTSLVQPALWWTALDAIASGRPEKMSPLPVTRTAQALRTATEGTALEPIGRIGGLLAAPEEAIRKNAGLSQYGQWGDWSVDRMLANMAADGTTSAEEAKRAMIERNPQDPIFAEANRRVQYEQMLHTPGAATLSQIAKGNVAGAIQSLPTLLFPGGLFPEGELKQRGLKPEYDNAWRRFKTGDDKAITKFFDDNPEYEARLALYSKPEDRLQQFLVNEIWDRYYKLDKPNQNKAVQLLGKQFEDSFMNKDTRAYDAIPVEQLALWSRMLGGLAPKTPETEAVAGLPEQAIPKPDYWSPEVSKAIEDYQKERSARYPNYYAVQEQYYQLPKGAARRSFLARFPQLKKYWDWKAGYKRDHPELAPYFNQPAGPDETSVTPQEIGAVTAPLSRAMLAYLLGGSSLTAGAKAELLRLASLAGRSVTPEEYARLLMAGMVTPQQ